MRSGFTILCRAILASACASATRVTSGISEVLGGVVNRCVFKSPATITSFSEDSRHQTRRSKGILVHTYRDIFSDQERSRLVNVSGSFYGIKVFHTTNNSIYPKNKTQ